MGWRGYTSEIPVGMIFRKMYCGHCGAKLKKKKIKRLLKKGDNGFKNSLTGLSCPIGMTSYHEERYIYFCPRCNRVLSYDEQCVVSEKQKKLKKLIVFDD